MALIKCPECGKEVSDRAISCPNCGFPIATEENTKADITNQSDNHVTEYKGTVYTICPECGKRNRTGLFVCPHCRHRYTPDEYTVIDENKVDELYNYEDSSKTENTFSGVYRYSLFGKKMEVYCPRCGSSNCSIFYEEHVTPAKTKTKYTANLNPLHPFTLVNKKEKVIKKETSYETQMYLCNSCGKKFE